MAPRDKRDQAQMDFAALLTRHPLVVFDAVCPLCSGTVRFVLRHDRSGRFRFVSAQSALGSAILGHFGQPLICWESNVLVEGGKAFFKSEAFFRIMRALPAPWSWVGRANLLPRRFADWLYDRIARNRYSLLGRTDRCMTPPPGTESRFLG